MESEQSQAAPDKNSQKAWFKTHQEWLFRLVFLILGVAIGFGLYWLISNDFFLNRDSSQPADSAATTQNQYILDKQVSVYLAWWDQDAGFASLQANKDKISTVHPVWYKIKADGSVQKFTGAESSAIIQFAKDNNIKIIPTFTNDCDPTASETVLQNASLIAAHVNLINKIVNDNNYDGADINYECLNGQPLRRAYSNFLTELSQVLHAENKLLTASVHQKTTDEGSWEGPAAQDWTVINATCDQIKIMTYDYHWATSEAGDIAPLSWMCDTLEYAKTILDPTKTYLGVHFYAYDWISQQATDLTYNEAAELINTYSPTVNLSAESEKYFSYASDGQNHTVYFADKDVVLPRLQLANEYNIAGIGIWRIGGEDSSIWQTIASEFSANN